MNFSFVQQVSSSE